MKLARGSRAVLATWASSGVLLVACGGSPATGGDSDVQDARAVAQAASESPAPDVRFDASERPPGDRGIGRHDLTVDERRGGHTIARHVARSDDELRDRFRDERLRSASTYTDLETAERVVAETLARSAARIDAWQRRDGPRPNLALRYRGARDEPIGRTLRRGRAGPQPAYDAIVVLRWDDRAQDAYVLTSYPEAGR